MTTRREVIEEIERLRCCNRLDALVHDLVRALESDQDCLQALEEICAAFHDCAKAGIRPRDAALLLDPIRKIKPASPLVLRLQQVY